MSFKTPNNKQIADALGNIDELPERMKIAVTDRVAESFQPMPKPDSGDWLQAHPEQGQTFTSFQRESFKATPHATHETIYIQPYGSFNHPRAAPLSVIAEFVRAFYQGCNVETLNTIDFPNEIKHRINSNTNLPQYHTIGFHQHLCQTRSKRDAQRELLCVAVTMSDLYPDPSWNFVYGQARMCDGVGVYSFARLDPLFPMSPDDSSKVQLTDSHRIVILRRSIKILLHELGHLFGLKHCIYYICLMNGANHEVEMDRQPLFLCPVCLRKLYSTFKFDVQTLYQQFAQLCKQYQLKDEFLWYKMRLQQLER